MKALLCEFQASALKWLSSSFDQILEDSLCLDVYPIEATSTDSIEIFLVTWTILDRSLAFSVP